MEFILMVVVFAAVFLFLPRILKTPIPSDPPVKETISQTTAQVVDSRIEHSLHTQSQIQAQLNSLEKQ